MGEAVVEVEAEPPQLQPHQSAEAVQCPVLGAVAARVPYDQRVVVAAQATMMSRQ